MSGIILLPVFVCLPASAQNNSAPVERLRATLFMMNADGSASVMDGNLTNYHDLYSNAVGDEDALKLSNNGENFCIVRDGKRLAIEQRKPIGFSDTTRFVMWNLRRVQYRLVLRTERLNHPNLRGFLEDAFTRTYTPINLFGETSYEFRISDDPASSAQNRFRIIFTQGRKPQLPVSINDILLFRNGNQVDVQWKVDNERDMADYTVEMSENGGAYRPVRTVVAYNNSDGLNYSISQPVTGKAELTFRIRGNATNGEVMYSRPASILVDIQVAGISIYPNPVVNKQARILFHQLPAGKYSVFLVSSNGTKISLGSVQNPVGGTIAPVALPASIQPGIYRIQVLSPDNKSFIQTIHVL